MKLVPNWRAFWRWHSTWALALIGILPVVWSELPPDLKATLPPEWQPRLFFALAIAGIAARLRDQGSGS
ncbi:hypothetical protein MASR1M32_38560 [Rhodobacter sp.]